MTKIEQWQEWAEQRKALQEKLGNNTMLKFSLHEDDIYKNGCVKYDADGDRIFIKTYNRETEISIYAGRGLLSVLKQLYEQP